MYFGQTVGFDNKKNGDVLVGFMLEGCIVDNSGFVGYQWGFMKGTG
jgi:hypothetical protein